MRLLISGTSGFIGSQLCPFLESKGFEVMRLMRGAPGVPEGVITWDIENGQLDRSLLEGFDGVVHLAGENIAAGRWTSQKKQRILNSRVRSTQLLAAEIGKLKRPPKLFLCASAIGYYGDRGEVYCSEGMPNGTGFLASVCKQWEEATLPISAQGVRTLLMRTGIVLSPQGGVLKKLLTPFSLGLGGTLGSGEQFMSWIALEDLLEIFLFVMQNKQVKGPLNLVAPHPVTNAVFTRALAKVLKRPSLFPAPASMLRLLLGKERADELLLSSIRARPDKLLEAGYEFRFPELEPALMHMLEK
jgi:uncharacterized protein